MILCEKINLKIVEHFLTQNCVFKLKIHISLINTILYIKFMEYY